MASLFGYRRPDFRSGRKALTYDEYWKRTNFSPGTQLCEREIILRDRVPEGSSVLVVGCGTSLLPLALAEKRCAVTVSDIAMSVIDFFSKKGIAGFILDLENITDTSIKGNYDVIVASEVFEHIRNPERAIEVLARHTRRFLIASPNSAFYRYRLRLMFAGRFLIQWKYHPAEHLRYWSHSDFLDWLSAMNLRTTAVVPAMGLSFNGLLPFAKNWWPNLFGNQIVYDCEVL
jgi:2-polyprenyl-3-methyl-5-hydroxy-6-metoxy-1,4-benzoquinol methylase